MLFNNEVNHFIDQIIDTQKQIETLTLNESVFIRILLLVLLDVLSKSALPGVQGNRKRFVKLIDTFSGWPDVNRYSIRQLQLLLKENRSKIESSMLEGFVNEIDRRIQQWPFEKEILLPCKVGPTVEEIGEFIDKEIENKIEVVRYPSLIWTVRNFAIHEMRHPGRGIDLELDHKSPYYHHFTWSDPPRGTWELYFPNGFISKLVADCTINLKKHFLEKDINPWEGFDSLDDW